MLLEHGAVSQLNYKNNAPVDLAALEDNWEVVDVFIKDLVDKYENQ